MKEFGHKRPRRDPSGEIVGTMESPATAITRETLGGAFLADRNRKLIVSLEAGDLICFRPAGTRRIYKRVAKDVYAWILRCEANYAILANAREKKIKRAERLAQQRQQRAEQRLFKK